jgi:hypothetical protein
MATRYSQYRTVTPALVEQRAAQRHRIQVTSTIQEQGGPAAEAMLFDLSVYGCRLVCRTRHAEGSRLLLGLRGDAPVAATVIWNDGEQLGCRFDTPIARSLMRSLTLVIC